MYMAQTLSLQLRTVPPQTFALAQNHDVHLHALDAVHTHLTQSLDLLGLVLSGDRRRDPASLASNLRLLAESLGESAALLKGPPLAGAADPAWMSHSVHPSRFSPTLGPNMSFHFGLQDSCIVLTIRALEPVHAPVHFGTKLGLAIGTVRRLEHDEMDLIFRYKPGTTADCPGAGGFSARHTPDSETRSQHHSQQADSGFEEVYVREKVRVDSADPSLISLYSKLGYLSNTLAQARRNLTAVIGAEWEG
jgi:hypothetical protein